MPIETGQTILVTGANSSLGRSVIEELSSRGHEVIATQRTDSEKALYFDLSMPGKHSLPDTKIDSVVAIAWDMRGRGSSEQETSVNGTLFLLNFAKQKKANFVFVSTISAESGASEYGRAKLRVENSVTQFEKGRTIRAGILIGPRATPIQTAISRLSAFPGVCIHLQPDRVFQVSKLEQIARAIAVTCESGKLQNLSHESMILSDIVHLLAKPGRKLHLNLPWRIPYYFLRLTDTLGHQRLPRSDSLLVLGEAEQQRGA